MVIISCHTMSWRACLQLPSNIRLEVRSKLSMRIVITEKNARRIDLFMDNLHQVGAFYLRKQNFCCNNYSQSRNHTKISFENLIVKQILVFLWCMNLFDIISSIGMFVNNYRLTLDLVFRKKLNMYVFKTKNVEAKLFFAMIIFPKKAYFT